MHHRCRWLVLSSSVIIGIILSAVMPADAQQDHSGRLALIDSLYCSGDYDGGLAAVNSGLSEDPDEYELLCWASELLNWKSLSAADESSHQEAKTLCQEALSYARRAVEVNPAGAQGWFQVGQTTGTLSQLPGGSETVDLARESKAAFERTLTIDPEHTGALHGLALWHRAVANLPGYKKLAARILFGGLPPASNDEAVILLKKAIRLEPGVIAHHLELGKTYLEMKEREWAREELETVLRLPPLNVRDQKRKEEAERLLSRIG